MPAERLREKPPDGIVAAAVKRAFGGGEEKIKVRGSDDVLVFRARCCNPIRGEKIVGYITRGKGVSVHSATCPNVVNLLYDPERRIEVEWDKSSGAEAAAPYTVKLTMEVEDRKGVLAAVSAKIADINTNIKNMEARTGDDESARADRRDRRDQRPAAPREGDQVAEGGERRAGCRAGGTRELRTGLASSDSPAIAMTSISMRASRGRRAAWTVERAG